MATARCVHSDRWLVGYEKGSFFCVLWRAAEQRRVSALVAARAKRQGDASECGGE
jgi:hypothetical protein